MISPVDKIVNKVEGLPDHWDKTATLRHRFTHTKGSTTLCVSVPPWRGRFYYDTFIKRRAQKAGYSYLEFLVPQTLLYPDCDITDELCEMIRGRMIGEINHWKEKYGLEKIELVGLSVGCVGAMLIANNNPSVSKIELVAPGNSLAESVWYGIRTVNFRRELERRGMTLEFLMKHWKKLAPENNLHGLEGKEISVYISKSDQIIPYRFGKKLVEKMHEKGLKPQVFVNKFLGHYGTVVRFLLWPRV